jgi:alpha-galactosidase
MLAKTPPMGWNSFNTFGADVNEKIVLESADAMAESGLKDAGYEYVVIDDGWSSRERGADGRIAPDPSKFPRGMKFIGDYIHAKGLKFGIYSSAGTRTCDNYSASFDTEFLDAKTFAEWGVDYLKYDYCSRPTNISGPVLYKRMGLALKASGRDILFSACNWGFDSVETWIRSIGAHAYRSTGDIRDNFSNCARAITTIWHRNCLPH